MEEEKEILKLTDYLNACLKFEENPSDENFNVIQDFLGKLQIKNYIGLKNKMIIMMNILVELNENFDAPGTAAQIELKKMKYALLAYCANLEDDAGLITETYGVYDAIYRNGLADAILAICERDYNKIEDMIAQAIDISNIKTLISSMQFFDDDQYEKWLTAIKSLREQLTPEIMEDVAKFNAVDGNSFVDKLSKLAAQNTLNGLDKAIAQVEGSNN